MPWTIIAAIVNEDVINVVGTVGGPWTVYVFVEVGDYVVAIIIAIEIAIIIIATNAIVVDTLAFAFVVTVAANSTLVKESPCTIIQVAMFRT